MYVRLVMYEDGTVAFGLTLTDSESQSQVVWLTRVYALAACFGSRAMIIMIG